MKNIGEINMRHIKICKPRLYGNQKNLKVQISDSEFELKRQRRLLLISGGHGCVPTGNIIDRG